MEREALLFSESIVDELGTDDDNDSNGATCFEGEVTKVHG